MTSLEMAGISITVLKQSDNVLLEYLDLKVSAPGWPNVLAGSYKSHLFRDFDDVGFFLDIPPSAVKRLPAVEPAAKTVFSGFTLTDTGKAIAKHAVAVATKAVSNCEDMLNQMDSGSGRNKLRDVCNSNYYDGSSASRGRRLRLNDQDWCPESRRSDAGRLVLRERGRALRRCQRGG